MTTPPALEEVAALRQRIQELEEGVRWIASHDNFGLTDGSGATRKCIDALVQRAASLLTVESGERTPEPEADVVERVADACRQFITGTVDEYEIDIRNIARAAHKE